VNKVRSDQQAAEKIASILDKQNEGLSKEERNRRLLELEKIASAIDARRAKSVMSQPTRETQAKARIHA
jgi:hypothetical protein